MPDRAETIFHEARALPPDQRDAYLHDACVDDRALRSKVDALLAADVETGDILRGSDATVSRIGPGSPTAALRQSEQAGQQIGRYKLLEQIGEGGFGSVWAAEQKEPVRRRVALKIIKLGMDTKQVIARFEAERQALAMMDHPNIAKVLDAGATDTGRPFFAMELVKGVPIIEYCDREKLDTRARLDLFMKVCHAIQHAHQKGIIHRDIKPSNVLVTMHDGKPVPKVIDFGIAKATNQELTEKTIYTQHHQMIGTPAYMSPEQAEMSGLDIDTRSDIYSLGVLLYEMLTGTTPFSQEQLNSAGFEGMMKLIREVEPHNPSTRLSSLGETGTRTAQQRQAADAKKLGLLLKGDLDWIVMRCLEKDRMRRYETANGLAEDIRRHLSGEAVLAAPPSNAYRFKKLIRRNKGPVAAGGAVAAALVLGLVGTSVGLVRAERARAGETQQRVLAEAARAEAQAQEAEAIKQAAEAKAQETEAKKQAEIAEAVATFQTEMLAAVDPDQLPKDPMTGEPIKDAVTVLQALQAAVKLLDEGGSALQDQPLVEARVRDTIGTTLLSLARYDEAEPNLRKSLEIRRASLPAGHPSIATSLNNLASLLQDQNRLAEAEPLLREALAIDRAALPAGHPSIAAGLHNLASLLRAQNKLAEAEPLFREALAIWRAALPAGHPSLATGLNNLAMLLRAQNKLAEAEPLFREALAIFRASLPAGHPNIAAGLHNLASLLQAQNKLAEAEPLFREALEGRRRVLGDDHPNTIASMNNLAALLILRQNYHEAEVIGVEHEIRSREVHGPAHDKTTHAINLLIDLYTAWHEAEPDVGHDAKAEQWRAKLERTP